MTEKTPRQKMAELAAEMQADHNQAMLDAKSWIDSDEGRAIIAKVAALRDRSIPGSGFDQVLGSYAEVVAALLSISGTAPNNTPAVVAPPVKA